MKNHSIGDIFSHNSEESAQKHFFHSFSIIFYFSISFGLVLFTLSTSGFLIAQPEPFSVVLTIFDISNDTGAVVTFASVQNSTQAKIFEPAELDAARDELKDGIGETSFSFPNMTVLSGEPFSACALTLKGEGVKKFCSEGRNSPSDRPEFIQISLYDDSSTK